MYPIIIVTHAKRWQQGHPWLYSNEIKMDTAAKQLPLGSLVNLKTTDGKSLGTGFFNPHSLIAVRKLSSEEILIDENFIFKRLETALQFRDRLYPHPFYRWIHAEADNLPGLIIDRYGPHVVMQVNTAGMELLTPLITAAIEKLILPDSILLQNMHNVRTLEKLDLYQRFAIGSCDDIVLCVENDTLFLADIHQGQKTGWFYDQRDNRALISKLAVGKSVLDCFCFTGSFGIEAAKKGAKQVIGIDRSKDALALAAKSATLNEVDNICTFIEGEAFEELSKLQGRHFDIVLLDPPAFVKSRKDLQAGLKGYSKLVRLAAPLITSEGLMSFTCCSHHVCEEDLLLSIRKGLEQAGRIGKIIKQLSAGMDHPLHMHLSESKYLKGFLIQLD
ncbi:MAG: class I SAM-dependent rRNA methyltransferase [Alphaproteobacteria bacterium]|nr:class I SAM-dependent rRNA methyltransferase [Alphaproteobacteria bacterium]